MAIVKKREMILSLLLELMGGVDHPASSNRFRNRGDIPENKRPAFVLLDGSEAAVAQTIVSQRRTRSRESPIRLRLTPQLFALNIKKSDAEAHLSGPEISDLIIAVQQAVLQSEALAALVGPNGDVAYKGHITDMQTGSEMVGSVLFLFEIDYWLMPEHLIT